MSQTKTGNLRQTMPETAKWVDRQRAAFGTDYVNGLIKRALGGEPGLFYAFEAGRVIGTPFPPGHPIEADQRLAVLLGCTFAGFIATPPQQQEQPC